ncbi:MAG: hypothetical protein IJ478_04675 [Alistipes sp.]|nr:hypothetical protein [Alistipes sp.]
MRKVRQMVAMVLCAVYLLGVGGAALSSLLCPCVEWHHHTAQCNHDHGHQHLDMHPLQAAHDADFSAPCCDDRHSNNVQLYTASSDEERVSKLFLPELPVALFEPQPELQHLASLCCGRCFEQLPLPYSRVVPTKGLRAPPVKA